MIPTSPLDVDLVALARRMGFVDPCIATAPYRGSGERSYFKGCVRAHLMDGRGVAEWRTSPRTPVGQGRTFAVTCPPAEVTTRLMREMRATIVDTERMLVSEAERCEARARDARADAERVRAMLEGV